MGTLPSNIVELIESDKIMSSVPKWDESDKVYYSILVPLTIGTTTFGGFTLRVKVSKEFAARDAMASLQYGPSRRSTEPLWRMDWKPTHRHNNKGRGAPGFEWAEFDRVSHDHNFADNYLAQANLMRRSLPYARPLSEEPSTLRDFLDFSGKCFRISNMSSIVLPVGTIDLFWTK